jgi:acetoin utilization deacetylase AcuC-like enzyme
MLEIEDERPTTSSRMVIIPTFYDPGFAAPIGAHVMPMEKFARVADGLKRMSGVRLSVPPPATADDLQRVHTPAYIEAIRSGAPQALAESQKFPWSPELYPSVCLTNGGVIAAAGSALDGGLAAAVASGFHHAHADHGEGFCTFNGLLVALERLRVENRIRSAAILDLDLHYGNGTASLVASRPWIRALSVYGNDYAGNRAYADVATRLHEDGENHFSLPLRAGCQQAEHLDQLHRGLDWMMQGGRPDLMIYQAGADPFREDPYSPLDLSIEDLWERDREVFRFAMRHRLPLAWVLAGGYTPDLCKVVEIHLNTFRAALEVYGTRT